ncbi:hypothetical protein [Halobellus sp. H-GB7]|uniref:hypothetical protein n=1 Tax=Halobellus sp. H-GB7 TaxID=3069756 RepID=UPI0027B3FBF5|nr:hypothetical protein [Halobellus sp. H-GB7]MDQ2055664.1 hypothetical protein [Halobellus sp. H-GB7]
MSRNYTPLRNTVGAAIGAGLVAAAVAGLAQIPSHGPPSRLAAEIVLLIRLEILLTTVNLVLLLVLSGIYLKLYRDLPNKYTVSLVVLSLALLLYAFSSNPLVHSILGFRPRPNIGAFVFIPDLFISIAILVLLYQSQT